MRDRKGIRKSGAKKAGSFNPFKNNKGIPHFKGVEDDAQTKPFAFAAEGPGKSPWGHSGTKVK